MIALIVGMSLAAQPTLAAQQVGPNLLQDGDFEWSAPWELQDGINEIQAAPGWRAWWVPKPPSSVPRPYNCAGGKDYGCYWATPEFRDVQKAAYSYRVHGGTQAQKYFTYGRMHQAGLMQKVGNIQPGTRLRFTIYMQAWMCFDYTLCNQGKVSDQPSNMHLKIGIDPNGGDNPFSPDIVWSSEQAAWDTWVQFQVEAVASNSTVTVFTHSRADWDWARANNDVYVDDGSLVAVGSAPAAQPTQPPAAPVRPRVQQPLATSTPTATSTPMPTATSTPTNTPEPTDTPLRRVATLPPDDTATPAPFQNLFNWLSGSNGAPPGGMVGVVFIGAALFLGAILLGIVIGQRRGPRAG